MVLPRTCPAGIDVLRASLSGVECTPPVQAWYRAELEAGRTTSLSDIDRKPPPAVLPYRHLAEGKGSWVTGKKHFVGHKCPNMQFFYVKLTIN